MASSNQKPKVIFLTGAPLHCELGSSEQLLTGLLPPHERFINGHIGDVIPDPTPSNNWPSWRALNVEAKGAPDKRKPFGAEQTLNQLSFFSAGSQHSQDHVNYDFLEHSLVVYTRATQDEADSTTLSFDESTFAEESFLSELTEGSYIAQVNHHTNKVPSAITNLKDLPKAAYLEKSYPQTITVNLIVGIISVAPPRTIGFRKVARSMQLIEVLVGDESKSGFSISFWLPPPKKNAVATDDDVLKQELSRLRSRQVVLMTNIALRVWQGRVYGQSLRVTRGRRTETGIERLDASKLSAGGGSMVDNLSALMLGKQKRVESWVVGFLHAADQGSTNTRQPDRRTDKRAPRVLAEQSELPPDTQ